MGNFQKPTQETRETPIRGRMKVCTIAVALMAIMVLSVMYTSAAPMESDESVPEDLEPIETERRSGNLFARCFDNNGCASGWVLETVSRCKSRSVHRTLQQRTNFTRRPLKSFQRVTSRGGLKWKHNIVWM